MGQGTSMKHDDKLSAVPLVKREDVCCDVLVFIHTGGMRGE